MRHDKIEFAGNAASRDRGIGNQCQAFTREVVHHREPSAPTQQAVRSDVERGKMMFGRDVANRLRLAVNELGAELNGNFEVRLMLCEDASAEARPGLEHDDATALLAEFGCGREAGGAGTYYGNVE